MTRTLIKICGVTRIADAEGIAALDVDVIGLNFVPGSPRRIAARQAVELISAIGGRQKVWALFVDAPAPDVRDVLALAPVDCLQFNGDESPDYCRSFGRPYIKAVHMRDDVDVAAVARRFADAQMLLLDTFVAGQAGGTGVAFDWRRWPMQCDHPLMLAGGLTADNVGPAIEALHPAGVDVCGGVESEHKGLKDLEKCRRFVAAARAADRHLAGRTGVTP